MQDRVADLERDDPNGLTSEKMSLATEDELEYDAATTVPHRSTRHKVALLFIWTGTTIHDAL